MDCLDEVTLSVPQDQDMSPFLRQTLTKYEDIVLPLDDNSSSNASRQAFNISTATGSQPITPQIFKGQAMKPASFTRM